MIPLHVQEILSSGSPDTTVAVVGASSDRSKYGNIIVRRLIDQGFNVFPINPRGGMIEGLQAYSDLGAVPDPVHLVNFVTPPDVTLQVLETIDPERFRVVWFQDGSWDEDCAALADSRFETVVRDACILVALSRIGARAW